MDRLVIVDVKEVELHFRPSQRCSSATFRVTNLMHTMAVAVHLTTTRPALFSLSPTPSAVLPPLSSAAFSLVLPPTAAPPVAAPPDAVLVRSTLLPTGKADASAVLRLFSRPGVHVFRDANLPISLVGPHVFPALLLLPSPNSIEAAFLLSKAVSACSSNDLAALLRRSVAAGNARFVSTLLRAGADAGDRGPDGRSALSLAVASGRADAVRVLLDAGARPDLALIHEAAAANRTDLITLLVAASSDPDSAWADDADPGGRTPLHAAVACGGLDAVRLCLDSGGGNPDRPDPRGWTPLHCAAAGGFLDVAQLLIDRSAYDAKRAVTRDGGKAPFDLAVSGGHARLYGALRLGDALHAAARAGDVGGVRECLSKGAEVDARDQNGWTPLHRAAFKGRVEVVRALIGNGARVDAVDDAGYTPLRCAVEAGQAEAALWLVAHGAGAGLKGIKVTADFSSPVSKLIGSCCGAKAVVVSSPGGELRDFKVDTS